MVIDMIPGASELASGYASNPIPLIGKSVAMVDAIYDAAKRTTSPKGGGFLPDVATHSTG